MENFSHIHDTFQWDPKSGIPPIHIRPPTRKKRTLKSTRDQKRDVQMADRCGLNTNQIIIMLNLSRRQVLYALDTPPTPKKSTGRPPILNTEQCKHLVDFVCASKKNRRISYKDLTKEFEYWDAGYIAIKNALNRKGFGLRWAMRKPLISEKNRKLRLAFALKYRSWNFRQ